MFVSHMERDNEKTRISNGKQLSLPPAPNHNDCRIFFPRREDFSPRLHWVCLSHRRSDHIRQMERLNLVQEKINPPKKKE